MVMIGECKSNFECFNCHKNSHFDWESQANFEERDNIVGENEVDEEPTLLSALNNCKNNIDECLWFLDNRESNYIVPTRRLRSLMRR